MCDRKLDALAELWEHGQDAAITLSGMERELGNALTVASGWVESLQLAAGPDSEGEQAPRKLRTAIERMRAALRRMSRRPAEPLRVLALVDVNELLDGVVDSLDPRVRQAFEVRRVCEPLLWTVIADARALEHVIVNLVMEAASVGEPGDCILIETTNLPAPVEAEREVSIAVRVHSSRRDNDGSGAPSGERWETRPVPPLSQRVVVEHAGRIFVTSCPSYPSNAVVILPACPSKRGPDDGAARA